jgi:hypothetical protein
MGDHKASSKVLTIDTINPHVREAQYAVRGVIPQRAETYRAQLAKGEGKDLSFDNVIFANIGNPQQLDQKPITFFRQVASLLEYPPLLEQEDTLIEKLGYKSDAIERARKLLKEVSSVGAYSNSSGAPGIKQSVANFIESKNQLDSSSTPILISFRARWLSCRLRQYLPLCRSLLRCQHSPSCHLCLQELRRPGPNPSISTLHCHTSRHKRHLRAVLPRRATGVGYKPRDNKDLTQESS